MKSKVYIASDHAGFSLKEEILKLSSELFIDLGTNSSEIVDYPDFAHNLITNVNSDEKAKGILICGSGIGMAITANRDINIRAGLAFNPEIAKLMRQHNDANVLVLPGRFINVHEALKCINIFLTTIFESGRHQVRIDKINRK